MASKIVKHPLRCCRIYKFSGYKLPRFWDSETKETRIFRPFSFTVAMRFFSRDIRLSRLEHIFPKMSPSFLKQYIQWQTNSALMFLCSNVFSQLLIHCTFVFTGWLDPNTKYCSILMSYSRITWIAIINLLCGKQQLGAMDLFYWSDVSGHRHQRTLSAYMSHVRCFDLLMTVKLFMLSKKGVPLWL